jgi:hypothetical protein
MKLMRTAIAAAMTASVLFAGAGTARAEEFRCTRTVGARTLDNVKVPAGKTCTLRGTTVKGTIKVNRNARLFAVGVRVVGNVQGENARRVEVRGGSRVGGSVQVVQGRRAFVKRVRVNGDILFDEQRRLVEARRNRVGGNIQAFQNTGGVVIKNNIVDGNLQCKENSPRPRGGGNRVHGNKEDQCRRL